MKKRHWLFAGISIGIASSFLLVLFICFKIDTWMNMDIVLSILFITITVLVFISLNYIYKRSVSTSLLCIYRNITKFKNIKEKQFDNNDPKQINDEINRIIREWSDESKEEIVQLKQVETYRKEFLGNVSHELKTPIFSVQGYIHTLIDGGIEDHDINMLYLHKASRGIDRLISMVDDLESISKLEAGELPVEPRTFDIVDLAKDVIESLEVLTREKSVRLYISEDSRPLYAYADKDLIRQVLVNLLVNSVKYGKKNGETRISLKDAGELVSIEIADNGIGIEKYHLPRLFERFYRVDKSRSREQGGTGLGLAIVKHIMEAHQQPIHVESEINSGTIFSFTLKKSK
jgi:two-component system, OmpR family, phosphate regulon sensor histidine kinase PhoR